MRFEDWGLIDFREGWERQKVLAEAVANGTDDTLVLCEHPDVITLGRNTKPGSVLTPPSVLMDNGVSVIEINRGGEATIHNPGQVVRYPIFNLQRSTPDLHHFLRSIEQAIIQTLQDFGLNSHRMPGLTGVWIEQSRKICAIGIHCSRWITSHGFALNVNNNLMLFNAIIPCGLPNKAVTSMEKELGFSVAIEDVKRTLQHHFFFNFQDRNVR